MKTAFGWIVAVLLSLGFAAFIVMTVVAFVQAVRGEQSSEAIGGEDDDD